MNTNESLISRINKGMSLHEVAVREYINELLSVIECLKSSLEYDGRRIKQLEDEVAYQRVRYQSIT